VRPASTPAQCLDPDTIAFERNGPTMPTTNISASPALWRSRPARRAFGIVGCLLVAVTLAGCAAGGSTLPESSTTGAPASPAATVEPAATATSTPTLAEEAGAEVPVRIESLPEYDAAESLVVGMWDQYSDPTNANYAPGLVAQNEGGKNYARDFLLILADLRSVFRFLPGTSSPDVAELTAQLQSYVDKATEAERKFLAGEDFGMSFSITNSDGTVYESDGTNKSND